MRAWFGAFHDRVTYIQFCRVDLIESNSPGSQNPLHNPLQELIGSCKSDSQKPPTESGCMRSGSLDEFGQSAFLRASSWSR